MLLKFAFAFWRPRLLRIAYSPPAPLPGLASMHLVAARLQHLELSAPALLSLEPFAAALPQLCCLSLRGCSLLRDGTLSSLCRLTTLRALDLGGLAALSDAAVFHVARLPQLAALNLSGTAAGDASLQFLTYGHRCAPFCMGYGAGMRILAVRVACVGQEGCQGGVAPERAKGDLGCGLAGEAAGWAGLGNNAGG